MFAYIDLISDVLVAEYGSERERVMRSPEQLRAETVRAILAGRAARRRGREPAARLRAAPAHVARMAAGAPRRRGVGPNVRDAAVASRPLARGHPGQELLGLVGEVRVDLDLVAVGAGVRDRGEVAPPVRRGVGDRAPGPAEDHADDEAVAEHAEEAAGVDGEERPEEQAPEEPEQCA